MCRIGLSETHAFLPTTMSGYSEAFEDERAFSSNLDRVDSSKEQSHHGWASKKGKGHSESASKKKQGHSGSGRASKEEESPWVRAIMDGDIAAMKTFISAGIDINALFPKSGGGRELPISLAAMHSLEATAFLLNSGVRVDETYTFVGTALQRAI